MADSWPHPAAPGSQGLACPRPQAGNTRVPLSPAGLRPQSRSAGDRHAGGEMRPMVRARASDSADLSGLSIYRARSAWVRRTAPPPVQLHRARGRGRPSRPVALEMVLAQTRPVGHLLPPTKLGDATRCSSYSWTVAVRSRTRSRCPSQVHEGNRPSFASRNRATPSLD